MGSAIKDIVFGWRALAKHPGSAVLSVFAFGLGIGLCTTMFSLVYGVFARGPDIEDPDRVVMILRSNPSQDQTEMGVPQSDFYDWKEQQTSFTELAAFRTGTVNLTGTEGPERYDGSFVTAATFNLLGVPQCWVAPSRNRTTILERHSPHSWATACGRSGSGAAQMSSARS